MTTSQSPALPLSNDGYGQGQPCNLQFAEIALSLEQFEMLRLTLDPILDSIPRTVESIERSLGGKLKFNGSRLSRKII